MQQTNQKTPQGSENIANWDKKIKAAHQNWSKIPEDEFTKLDGTRGKLASLVENRYHVSHSEAESQVKKFCDKQ